MNLVFAVNHKESKLPGQQVIDWFQEKILRNPNKTVVGQNTPYDLTRINRASSKGPQSILCFADCSMAHHFLLNEKSTNRRLKFLVETFTDLGAYKEEVDVKKLAETDLKKVAKYNGIDSYAPLAVIQGIDTQLKKEEAYNPRAVEYFKRLIPYVSTIESFGFKVDVAQLESVEKEILSDLETEKSNFEKEYACSIASPLQVSKLLFNELGFKVPNIPNAYRKDGLPRSNDKVLEWLEGPIVDRIKTFRFQQKLATTYIRGTQGNSIFENLDSEDIVYPEFFYVKHHRGGSVSRISAKRPPLQVIPKGSKPRRCFISRYPDGILLELDFSQAELRYGACASLDPNLITALVGDPHQATADLLGVDRFLAKNINFGLLYGVTVKGLMEKFGLSKVKALQIKKTLDKTFAGAFKFLEGVKQEATMSGKVSLPYGFRLHVPGATPSTGQGRAILRQAANYAIQRPASDMAQMFGWYLMHQLDGLAVPVMTNHDGLTWDLPQKNLDAVLDKIASGVLYFPKLIEEVLGLDVTAVPFPVDVKIGTNWLEMETIENEK